MWAKSRFSPKEKASQSCSITINGRLEKLEVIRLPNYEANSINT
jgi:hypothetical protein